MNGQDTLFKASMLAWRSATTPGGNASSGTRIDAARTWASFHVDGDVERRGRVMVGQQRRASARPTGSQSSEMTVETLEKGLAA
jgi:hypothetical protein